NPDSIRGLYLDGVVLDEFATMAPEAWTQVVRPTLSDRRGWAIFISTPKGTNAFHKMYLTAIEEMKRGSDEWFGALYKASETGILPKSELDGAKATMSDAEYRQEYECDFSAALLGAYFGKEMADAA